MINSSNIKLKSYFQNNLYSLTPIQPLYYFLLILSCQENILSIKSEHVALFSARKLNTCTLTEKLSQEWSFLTSLKIKILQNEWKQETSKFKNWIVESKTSVWEGETPANSTFKIKYNLNAVKFLSGKLFHLLTNDLFNQFTFRQEKYLNRLEIYH